MTLLLNEEMLAVLSSVLHIPIPLKINWVFLVSYYMKLKCVHTWSKKKEVVKSKPLIQLQTSFVKSASWRVLYAWPTLFSWLQYILFLLRYIGYIRVLLIYRHNNFRVGFFIYLGIRLESEICLHNIFKLFSRNFVGKYLLQWQVLLFLG